MQNRIINSFLVLTGVSSVLLSLLVSPVSVEAEDSLEKESVFTLGEIEVIGRIEENKNITIDKIYDEEMLEFNSNNVSDAVNLLPGVTLSRSGARNEQFVFVRGFDIKQVPIFLDGIPVYVPYDGYPDLGRFTTFDLSEIVVSKGFTSVLYGPNTMGGVINMVSRKPEKTFEGNAGIGYGSGNSYNAYLNLGTNQKTWYFQGGASYLNSDYFRLSDDFTPTKAEDGGKRNNSYQRDDKVSLKLGYTPSKDDEYAFSYINQHAVKGVPPYAGSDPSVTIRYWKWPYWDKQSYYFTSKTNFSSQVYLKTRAYWDIFKNSLFSYDDDTYTTITKKYAFKSYYDDHTYGGSVELGTTILPENLIKLAVHYKRDVHKEHNEGNPVQTFQDDILSIGLEDTITILKKMYAIAGASFDRVNTVQAQNLNSQKQLVDFPRDNTSAFNPQLGLFYTLTDTGTLHATVAQKSRMPSIKDKYSYRLGSAIPNPNLKAERSVNYEIGYQDTLFKRLLFKTAAFYSDVSDFILLTVVPDPTLPGKTITQNQNIGKVGQYGLEFEVSGLLTNWLEGGFNYTYLYVNNKSNSDKIINIPRHKIFTYLKYMPISRLTALADMEYDSSRFSSSNGVEVARAFTVFDAKIMYELIKGFYAEAGVRNIFDRNYAVQEGYPEPGRNYFVNMRYTF